MPYALSYATQQWLKSFGSRLQQLAAPGHQLHVDQQVKSDSLRFNLVPVLAHVIQKLTFPDRTWAAVEKAVRKFNQAHGLALTLDELVSQGWLRLINEEVVLPAAVASFTRQLTYAAEAGHPRQVPADQVRLLEFLGEFRQQYDTDQQGPSISQADLDQVLAAHATSTLDARFLLEKEILVKQARGYRWRGGNYVPQLAGELAASLWLLVGGEQATEAQLRRYVRCLMHTGVWPGDLQPYLTFGHAARLSELAAQVLLHDADLLDTGQEFAKIWLDMPTYGHLDVTQAVPRVEFSHESSWALLQSFAVHKWRFREVFDHEASREPYALLARLATTSALGQAGLADQFSRLLKAVDRPFVVREAFRQLRRCAQVIPQLLTDPQLMPLAFKALDKLELAPFLVAEQDNREEHYRQISELKAQLWEELFGGALDILVAADEDLPALSEALGHVLLYVAGLVFTDGHGTPGITRQQTHMSLYARLLVLLGSKRITHPGYFSGYSVVPPRLIDLGFAAVVRPLLAKPPLTAHHDLLQLDLAALDLGAELLQLSYAPGLPDNAGQGLPLEALSEAQERLVRYLRGLLHTYFSTSVIPVETYTVAGPEPRAAQRGGDYFGTELVSWGLLYLRLYQRGLLDSLTTDFLQSLQLNHTAGEGKYERSNQLAAGKLRLLLKSLLLAHLSLHREAAAHEAAGRPVQALLRWLEATTERLAARYVWDDLAQGRLDLFDESVTALSRPTHWVDLTTLLYRSLNLSESPTRGRFIRQFFAQSVEIGRMLAALNQLDAAELRDLVAQRLEQISVDDFLAGRYTITDLETALVEAINSRTHWQVAQPLLERLRQHLRERSYRLEAAVLLFEVELLLALKLGDSDRLARVEEPAAHLTAYGRQEQFVRLRHYYQALDRLDNQQEYAEAVPLLESLLVADDRNVRYAFHLYRARTLLAMREQDTQLLGAAHQQWEQFLGRLSDQEKQKRTGLLAAIDGNSLPYLAYAQDDSRFDQVVNRLPAGNLFDRNLLETVFRRYVARSLPERAFTYLADAERYYATQKLPSPPVLWELRQWQPDMVTTDRLRTLLGGLASQRAEVIPQIMPAGLNGGSSLHEFILYELIQAAKVLAEKIEGIRQVSHENRFNDLIKALLNLRLAVWGWAIHDQPRVGRSEGGQDAGEADMLIAAAGNTLAVVEALIRRDEAYTIRHILKCQNYVANVSRFYVLTYHLAERGKLSDDWAAYKQTVLAIDYPADFALNPADKLEDLSGTLRDAEYLRVAKTKHGANSVIFHLMLNLAVNTVAEASKPAAEPKAAKGGSAKPRATKAKSTKTGGADGD